MSEQGTVNYVPHMIKSHAATRPEALALVEDEQSLTYSALDTVMDKVAAKLQASGLKRGDIIALCDANSLAYAVLFLSSLRAGIAPALIAPSATKASIAEMTIDSGAKMLFLDPALQEGVQSELPGTLPALPLTYDALTQWANTVTSPFDQPDLLPGGLFNIIYSSGTTGKPKGIVQDNLMRSNHIERGGVAFGYDTNSVTLVATPLYSNTTLVSFVPAIALGGKVVIMRKFDTEGYLTLAEKHRATHAMLVPVQYKRLMECPTFDSYDLSSYKVKFSTSAPFAARLKQDIVKRWPGVLVEFYGMTEGGGTCVLVANEFPDKLHTVGRPIDTHDIRLIGEDGKEVAKGEIGEVVGHSGAMMTGYHDQPEKTREAEWYDDTGKRFIRTGDVGRFDEDGFLTLMDRKKDMIDSGGFNIYPSDLEAVLFTHDDIHDATVIGVPSEDWGETPVAYVVPKANSALDTESLKVWFSERVGKTQRLSDIVVTDSLPRSAIGKVLKRELRVQYLAENPPA